MSNSDELLANNESYVSGFGDKAELPLPPGRKTVEWRAWTRGSTSTGRSGSRRAMRM
jgi:hypothetical protein